ncbi:uncharacterized protein LOC106663232 isoform X2 [Cimex lectularius]|uniref:Uncharacterized protein n=1 Tax=Cimex lectularius TaxID=79782 RepID=A0A8I6TEA3_CIMLE|nr:uncharacterized protein LOC106663232 isoform X2 [Cimex lectularius]
MSDIGDEMEEEVPTNGPEINLENEGSNFAEVDVPFFETPAVDDDGGVRGENEIPIERPYRDRNLQDPFNGGRRNTNAPQRRNAEELPSEQGTTAVHRFAYDMRDASWGQGGSRVHVPVYSVYPFAFYYPSNYSLGPIAGTLAQGRQDVFHYQIHQPIHQYHHQPYSHVRLREDQFPAGQPVTGPTYVRHQGMLPGIGITENYDEIERQEMADFNIHQCIFCGISLTEADRPSGNFCRVHRPHRVVRYINRAQSTSFVAVMIRQHQGEGNTASWPRGNEQRARAEARSQGPTNYQPPRVRFFDRSYHPFRVNSDFRRSPFYILDYRDDDLQYFGESDRNQVNQEERLTPDQSNQ